MNCEPALLQGRSAHGAGKQVDGAAAWGHPASLEVPWRWSLHATTDAPQDPGQAS